MTSPQCETLQLGRSAFTGIAASLADLFMLTCLVEIFGLSPLVANVPSLALGAIVQFMGCRYWAFRKGIEGSFFGQLGRFIAVEAAAFILNAILFHMLVTAIGSNYSVSRLIATFAVYISFSYPLWNKIFSTRSL